MITNNIDRLGKKFKNFRNEKLNLRNNLIL